MWPRSARLAYGVLVFVVVAVFFFGGALIVARCCRSSHSSMYPYTCGLTLRSTGPAGSCFDLRSSPQRGGPVTFNVRGTPGDVNISPSRRAILRFAHPLRPFVRGSLMATASLSAFLLALVIVALSMLTAKHRGRFAWLLSHFDPEALQVSAHIARILCITAVCLVVFGTLLVLLPHRVAELAHWATLVFAVIPFMVASLWSTLRHRAP